MMFRIINLKPLIFLMKMNQQILKVTRTMVMMMQTRRINLNHQSSITLLITQDLEELCNSLPDILHMSMCYSLTGENPTALKKLLMMNIRRSG